MRIDLSTIDIAAFVTAYFTAANSACSDSLSSASSYFSQFDIKDASLHKLEFYSPTNLLTFGNKLIEWSKLFGLYDPAN